MVVLVWLQALCSDYDRIKIKAKVYPEKFYDAFMLNDNLVRGQRYMWVLLNKKWKVMGIYSSDEKMEDAVYTNEIQVKSAEERGLPKVLADEMRIQGIVKTELSTEPWSVRPWNELPPGGLIVLSA